MLGLSDTFEISDIDICHQREVSKTQTCKTVHYMDFIGLILEKISQYGTLKQIMEAFLLLKM